MSLSETLRIAIVALYGAGTAFFFIGLFSRGETVKKIAGWLAIAGFAMHTGGLYCVLNEHGFTSLPQNFAIKMLSWSLLLVFFILWWRLKHDFLGMIAAPLAFLLYLFSLTLPKAQAVMPPSLSGPFFALHIGSLCLSFGMLAMAFGAGILFLHVNKKIKTKEKLTGFRKDLPALSTFDKINHWAAVVGFPLFTLGMLSGFIWAHFTWGKVVTWDPKEVISLGIWVLYAFFFYQRLAQGWRGRKPAVLAMFLFGLAVVSLLGVNFFLPTHHSMNPNV